MKDSSYYIEEIKKKQEVTSDYAVSKLLGVTRQMMTQYKNGRSSFDTDLVFKVAELSGHNELEIIANIRASRAKDPEFIKKWQALAKQLSALSACVILTFTIAFNSDFSVLNAEKMNFEVPSVYIMLSKGLFYILIVCTLFYLSLRPTSRYISPFFLYDILSHKGNLLWLIHYSQNFDTSQVLTHSKKPLIISTYP